MTYYIRYLAGDDWTIWETNSSFTKERKVYDCSSGQCLTSWCEVPELDYSRLKIDVLTIDEYFLEIL